MPRVKNFDAPVAKNLPPAMILPVLAAALSAVNIPVSADIAVLPPAPTILVADSTILNDISASRALAIHITKSMIFLTANIAIKALVKFSTSVLCLTSSLVTSSNTCNGSTAASPLSLTKPNAMPIVLMVSMKVCQTVCPTIPSNWPRLPIKSTSVLR